MAAQPESRAAALPYQFGPKAVVLRGAHVPPNHETPPFGSGSFLR